MPSASRSVFNRAGSEGKSLALLAPVLAFLPTLAFAPTVALAAPAGFPTQSPVRFIITGDSGTGEKGQYAVAHAIETVCAERGCQFALDMGDNIYEYGPRKVDDAQFADKFEKPYAKLAFPFFMALGNHDQSGIIPGSGVYPEKGDIEVEYTKRSTKWMLPARYYHFAAPFANATDYQARVSHPVVEFFVIDTNPLAPQDKPQREWYLPFHKYDNAQRAWLRDSLAKSDASWKIVFGHHPYRNNGRHGNAGQFEGIGLARGTELKKMIEAEVCGKADFYFSGHDHTLQWLKPYAPCGAKPEFVISGAAAKSNHPGNPDLSKLENPAFWQAFEKLGFFWAEATADHVAFTAYTVDGTGKPTRAFERTVTH